MRVINPKNQLIMEDNFEKIREEQFVSFVRTNIEVFNNGLKNINSQYRVHLIEEDLETSPNKGQNNSSVSQ